MGQKISAEKRNKRSVYKRNSLPNPIRRRLTTLEIQEAINSNQKNEDEEPKNLCGLTNREIVPPFDEPKNNVILYI